MPPETTPNQNTQPTAAGMSGGPGDAPASSPATPSQGTGAQGGGGASAPAKAAPAPASAPIFVGGRRFNSTEELAVYTSQLESRQAKIQGAVSGHEEQTEADPDSELADMVFEDPKTFVKLVTEKAKREIRAEDKQISNEKEVWQKFYTDYPDLSGNEDLVDVVLAKNRGSLSSMSLEDAAKELATKTRERISSIRGNTGGGTTLPSGPARTAGVGGGQGAPAQTETKPTSFVDQVRRMQNRK